MSTIETKTLRQTTRHAQVISVADLVAGSHAWSGGPGGLSGTAISKPV